MKTSALNRQRIRKLLKNETLYFAVTLCGLVALLGMVLAAIVKI